MVVESVNCASGVHVVEDNDEECVHKMHDVDIMPKESVK